MKALLLFIKTHKILFILIGVYIVYFSFYTLVRNHSFYTGEFDLGNMKQTLWNTLHGHFFMESDPTHTTKIISRLGDHVDLSLLLVLPFYALFPTSQTLLIFQTIVIALGAIPVYLYVRQISNKDWLAYLFAFFYLLLPGVEYVNLFDFHAVSFCMPCILFMFYFFTNKKYWQALPFFVIALLSKEEVGFTLFLICLYFIIVAIHTAKPKLKEIPRFIIKEQLWLVLLAIGSFIYSIVVIHYVIPHFREGPSIYILNYPTSGNGELGIIKYYLTHLGSFFQMQKDYIIRYISSIFAPLSFLSLLSPISLLTIPELLIDSLSQNHYMQEIFYQYTAVINPLVLLSSAWGFLRVSRWIENHIPHFSIQKAAIAMSCVLFVALYFISPLFGMHFLTFYALDNEDRDYILQMKSQVKPTDTVSASNDLAPEFANRYNIYTYPTGKEQADWILVEDEKIPTPTGYQMVYAGSRVFVYKKAG